MADEFSNYDLAPSNPAERSETIVPHDTNELTAGPRAIFVGTGGTIVGRLKDDAADRTFKNLPSGSFLPLRLKLIKTTSTAADILALY
ncbi:hypothetical protein BH09PSE4_BH09PSE4_17910 [soil metagenome]